MQTLDFTSDELRPGKAAEGGACVTLAVSEEVVQACALFGTRLDLPHYWFWDPSCKRCEMQEVPGVRGGANVMRMAVRKCGYREPAKPSHSSNRLPRLCVLAM